MLTEQREYAPSPHASGIRARAPWRWVTGLALAVLLGGSAGFWVTQRRDTGSAAANQNGNQGVQAHYGAYGNVSVNRLRTLGVALHSYSADREEHLPPMDDPEAVKQALLPYLEGKQDLFYSPFTGQPYAANPWIGKLSLTDFEFPYKVVTFYEAEPDPRGMRRAAFLDGHVQTFTEEKWREIEAFPGRKGFPRLP
ncbi:MAG: hypothetical protein KY468_02985 [Armatimonadetes bacterium]|nr:hypothetical protein [Armatimonadota bacterium]